MKNKYYYTLLIIWITVLNSCDLGYQTTVEKNYPNGYLKEKYGLKNGKLNGMYLSFDTLGRLSKQIEYNEGKKNGVLAEYSTEGLLLKISKWENDSCLAAKEYSYYKSGMIKYINDITSNEVKDGICLEYHTGGELNKKVRYRQGKQEGATDIYDYEDGTRRRTHFSLGKGLVDSTFCMKEELCFVSNIPKLDRDLQGNYAIFIDGSNCDSSSVIIYGAKENKYFENNNCCFVNVGRLDSFNDTIIGIYYEINKVPRRVIKKRFVLSKKKALDRKYRWEVGHIGGGNIVK